MKGKILINQQNLNDNFSNNKEITGIELNNVDFDSINIDINSFERCYKLILDNVQIHKNVSYQPLKSVTVLLTENQIINIEILNQLFPNLVELEVRHCIIEDDPKVIFKHLKYIHLRDVNISNIPKFVYYAKSLDSLTIGQNSIRLDIPNNLIDIKNLRRLILYNLEISYFYYPFNEVKLIDENDFFGLWIEDCTIHNFPKVVENIPNNFWIKCENCDFKNYSIEELNKWNSILSQD